MAARRWLGLALFLALPGCFGSDDEEDPAPAASPQTIPAASECVAETYSKALCPTGTAHWVCNGSTQCDLVETIPRRDERANPLPNQESIYWSEWPAGPRYVYCCKL